MVFDGIRQSPGEKCVAVRHPPSFATTTVKTVLINIIVVVAIVIVIVVVLMVEF